MNKGKTILVIMGARSACNASYGISRSLATKGYHVIYSGIPADKVQVEEQGFEFITMEFLSSENYQNEYFPFLQFRLYNRKSHGFLDKMYQAAEDWLDQNKPDIVLLDSNLLMFSIPFLRKKIPIINLGSTWSDFYQRKKMPVFSSSLPSGNSSLGVRIKIELLWLKILAKQFFRNLWMKTILHISFGFRPFKTIPQHVKAAGGRIARTEYGFRLIVPEVILAPEQLEFEAQSNSHRLYAGACIYEGRKEPDFNFSVLDPVKSLIYCSLGSASPNYEYSERFYRNMIESMKFLDGHQVIIHMSGLKDKEVYGKLPPNVFICKNAPQLEILKRACVFVTHGGCGAVKEAVFYGVPMVVVPGWHDQFGNSARVLSHSIGMRGSMKNTSPEQLAQMIMKTAHDPLIRKNICRFQEVLRDPEAHNKAVKFIDNFVLENTLMS